MIPIHIQEASVFNYSAWLSGTWHGNPPMAPRATLATPAAEGENVFTSECTGALWRQWLRMRAFRTCWQNLSLSTLEKNQRHLGPFTFFPINCQKIWGSCVLHCVNVPHPIESAPGTNFSLLVKKSNAPLAPYWMVQWVGGRRFFNINCAVAFVVHHLNR